MARATLDTQSSSLLSLRAATSTPSRTAISTPTMPAVTEHGGVDQPRLDQCPNRYTNQFDRMCPWPESTPATQDPYLANATD